MQDQCLDLEQETSLRLGKFIVAFAYLETNLAMRVIASEPRSDQASANSNISDPRSVADLLSALLQIVDSCFEPSTIGYASWIAWYMRADAVRETRNRFVHSKWVALWHQNLILSVTGIPGQLGRDEKFLTLGDLDREIKEVCVLTDNLTRLSRKFPLD